MAISAYGWVPILRCHIHSPRFGALVGFVVTVTVCDLLVPVARLDVGVTAGDYVAPRTAAPLLLTAFPVGFVVTVRSHYAIYVAFTLTADIATPFFARCCRLSLTGSRCYGYVLAPQ